MYSASHTVPVHAYLLCVSKTTGDLNSLLDLLGAMSNFDSPPAMPEVVNL